MVCGVSAVTRLFGVPGSVSAAAQCAPGTQPGLPRSCEASGARAPWCNPARRTGPLPYSAAAATRRPHLGPVSGLLLQVCSQCVSAAAAGALLGQHQARMGMRRL